jgi:LmbE family N-acetylglucosaminyl deacetylase
MTLFDPDPSLRWLFCMTHPDDEISICAWMHRLATLGAHVSVSWTHSTPTREQEARAVATLLGIPQENLYFLNATDGRACQEMLTLLPKFQTLVQQVQPDRVCCGAFEQGHLDHDATNFLVNQTFKGPILEIPFYHTYTTRLQTLNRFSNPQIEEVRNLDPQEQRLKKQVARQYPSTNIWSVLLWYEVWQLTRFKPMALAKTERMRLQTNPDFLKPAHPEPTAQKVLKTEPWQTWCQSVQDFKASQS